MKNYKEILEGVVNIINTTEKSDIGFTNIYAYISENYSEIKENEETNAPTEYGKYIDECLNEAAKHFFSEGEDKYSVADLFYAGIKCKEDWLKKQDEQKFTQNKESGKFESPNVKINDAIEVSSRMKYIADDLKPIAEFILDYANWDLDKDEWRQPTITVPVFRVLDALINKGKPYSCCN